MKKSISAFFIFFGCLCACSQTPETDSLKTELTKNLSDTARCNLLFYLAETAGDDEWPRFNEQLKNISEAQLKLHRPGAPLYIFFRRKLASAINNIGYLARLKGNIPLALENMTVALKMRENMGDAEGTAESLNNLADIYEGQGEEEKAFSMYKKSLSIFRELRDKEGMAYTLNNIGLIYKNKGDFGRALAHYQESLMYRQEVDDKEGIASSLNNIGSIYFEKGDYQKALRQYEECLVKYKEIDDMEGVAYSLNNIGAAQMKQKEYGPAIQSSLQSLKISQGAGYPEDIRNAAEQLYALYSLKNNHKQALFYFELYIQMRDSLTNEENKKASVKSQLKYEYEKKSAADSVKHTEEQKVKDAMLVAQTAQIKQEKFQRYSLIVGLLLVLCGLLFVVNRFRVTSKQKKIIEQQKLKVDEAFDKLHEKNKEVMDSILYAQRIQRALLPTSKYIERVLNKTHKQNF